MAKFGNLIPMVGDQRTTASLVDQQQHQQQQQWNSIETVGSNPMDTCVCGWSIPEQYNKLYRINRTFQKVVTVFPAAVCCVVRGCALLCAANK